MAFIRYKGPYAYLVHNERVGEGPQVKQKVLYYFGREITITDEVIADVETRFPGVTVDWDSLEITGNEGEKRQIEDSDWLEWD